MIDILRIDFITRQGDVYRRVRDLRLMLKKLVQCCYSMREYSLVKSCSLSQVYNCQRRSLSGLIFQRNETSDCQLSQRIYLMSSFIFFRRDSFTYFYSRSLPISFRMFYAYTYSLPLIYSQYSLNLLRHQRSSLFTTSRYKISCWWLLWSFSIDSSMLKRYYLSLALGIPFLIFSLGCLLCPLCWLSLYVPSTISFRNLHRQLSDNLCSDT